MSSISENLQTEAIKGQDQLSTTNTAQALKSDHSLDKTRIHTETYSPERELKIMGQRPTSQSEEEKQSKETEGRLVEDICHTGADEQTMAEIPTSQPKEEKPSIKTQVRSEEEKPSIETQVRSEEEKPSIETQVRSEEEKPSIETQVRSEEEKPSIETQVRSEEEKPSIETQVRSEEEKPSVETQVRSEEEKPSIETEGRLVEDNCHTGADKQTMAEIPTRQPTQEKPPIETQVRSEEEKPSINTEDNADKKRFSIHLDKQFVTEVLTNVTSKADKQCAKWRQQAETCEHTETDGYIVRETQDNEIDLRDKSKPHGGWHFIRDNWVYVTVGLLVAVVSYLYVLLGATTSSDFSNSSVLQIFQHEFENLRTDFPGQNEVLWIRSQKMLQKHLNNSHPNEPITLILTAARDGELTLRCLSNRLARAYSSSLNATWLLIDGLSKATQDSNIVKLQIDETLSSGFQSTSRAAVLHRLEELPAGSLLILYKYCDHENAAFKNVALVLTVLLEEPTLEPGLPLRELEEKVRDFFWEKFARPSSLSSHSEMNADKLSGVWSRISHLVLPVLPIQTIEASSCP